MNTLACLTSHSKATQDMFNASTFLYNYRAMVKMVSCCVHGRELSYMYKEQMYI